MAKDYTARRPGLVAVRLDLEPADRDILRVQAAKAGVPMSEYARTLVLTAIRKKEKKSLDSN